MTDSTLIPKCGKCDKPMKRDEAMCICVESTLPGLELHRAQPLARRILYLEAQVEILVGRETERSEKRKPHAAKRPEASRSANSGTGHRRKD